MPYFTIRLANKDTPGNPGVRFFVDGKTYVIKNHIVLFEKTIFVAEKNINSLLEMILREPKEVADFYNKKHNRQYKWHIDKKKLNIKDTLQLPNDIEDYKLKTVGVAISKDKKGNNGINGNIVILYTENGNDYPANDYVDCTLDEQINEIEFNLHIKIVEESIENIHRGAAHQLYVSCATFATAPQNNNWFNKALLFAKRFKDSNLPKIYFFSEGEEVYKRYCNLRADAVSLNNTMPILTQSRQHKVNTQAKNDGWQIVSQKKAHNKKRLSS